MTILDGLTLFFVFGGVSFFLLAGIGIIKFPDVLTRMAAVSKAATLGLILLLTASFLQAQDWVEYTKILFIICIVYLTFPTASHMIGRAACRSRAPLHFKMQRDDRE